MNLADLQFAPDYSLGAPSILHRVQRAPAHRNSIAIGVLRVPPGGLLLNRFDLPDDVVGYFAEIPEAAVYESICRREVHGVSTRVLSKRALLALRTTVPIAFLDLRPHAPAWPVLQSLRYARTQQLALEARNAGYAGVVYRSAQQYGADCYAVFGASLRGLRLVSKAALATAAGNLHRAAAAAIRGSRIPLLP